jgi:hypothetical protein
MYDAIGITRMIYETCLSSFGPGIDVYVGVKSHDIQHPFILISAKELLQISPSDSSPHVFNDEFSPLNVLTRPETLSLGSSIEEFDIHPFLPTNAPISASLPSRAVGRALF